MASNPSLAQALATLRTADAGLGAFAAVRDDASAAALAQRLQGPLAGQWVAVKDIFDTADLPTGYGSPSTRATAGRRGRAWWPSSGAPAAWSSPSR